MRNEEYHLPDWVGKTSYWCYFMADQDWYKTNRGS